MKRVLVFVGLCFWVAAAPGCGYTTRAHIAADGFRTIYVAPFSNKIDMTSETNEGSRFKTYFPLMENTIKNAVVDRYIFDGTLKVVKEDAADVILKGSVVHYRRDILRSSSGDDPEEYRVTVFVDLTLTDAKTGALIWEKKNFGGDSTYYTTGQYVKTESEAIQDAMTDLARRIVEATVETW